MTPEEWEQLHLLRRTRRMGIRPNRDDRWAAMPRPDGEEVSRFDDLEEAANRRGEVW